MSTTSSALMALPTASLGEEVAKVNRFLLWDPGSRPGRRTHPTPFHRNKPLRTWLDVGAQRRAYNRRRSLKLDASRAFNLRQSLSRRTLTNMSAKAEIVTLRKFFLYELRWCLTFQDRGGT